MSELANFYDSSTEGETLGTRLPDGTYVFAVDETEVDSWDDGRPRLVISTKVAAGEFEGLYGPRLTLTLGASRGTTKGGRAFEITEEDAAKRVRVTVKAIHPTVIRMRNPSVYDQAMLEDIAAQLTDEDTFVGTIKTKNGSEYANFSRVYSESEPPKGFTDPRRVQAFSLPA